MRLLKAKTGNDPNLEAQDDRELLRIASEGERRAFEVLFKRHYLGVRRIVTSVLGPVDEVEDVVQNVFMRIFRTGSDFQGKAKFTSWLYRIAVNMTYDHMRRKKRRNRLIEHFLENRSDEGLHDSPLDESLSREEIGLAMGALNRIKENKRTVFILFELQGMTLEEIAQSLNLSTTTVWSRLYQARKDFRKHYEKIT